MIKPVPRLARILRVGALLFVVGAAAGCMNEAAKQVADLAEMQEEEMCQIHLEWRA
ncbi:hypothetical protein IIA16_00230 [bacterium]|nr:hypothetical protein [bacterium]